MASEFSVRRVNSAGIAYGEPVDLDDVSWEVREELADAKGAEGEIKVGGQTYRWTRIESEVES